LVLVPSAASLFMVSYLRVTRPMMAFSEQIFWWEQHMTHYFLGHSTER
jgi:hypothetical protein